MYEYIEDGYELFHLEGDEAVLLGRQGDEQIDAEEMAAWLDTISYEVLCSPSKRVPRVYINE